MHTVPHSVSLRTLKPDRPSDARASTRSQPPNELTLSDAELLEVVRTLFAEQKVKSLERRSKLLQVAMSKHSIRGKSSNATETTGVVGSARSVASCCRLPAHSAVVSPRPHQICCCRCSPAAEPPPHVSTRTLQCTLHYRNAFWRFPAGSEWKLELEYHFSCKLGVCPG